MTTSSISIALDIITAGLIFFPVWAGASRGAKRTLFTILALVISAAAGYTGAKLLAPSFYDEYVQARVHTACVAKAQQYDPVRLSRETLAQYGVAVTDDEIRQAIERSGDAVSYAKDIAEQNGINEEELRDAVDKLSAELLSTAPEAVQKAAPEVINQVFDDDLSNSEAYEAVQAAVKSPEALADYSEEHYVRPVAMTVINAALFVSICIAVRLLMLLVYAACGVLRKNSHTAGDRFLGAVLGLVQGGSEVMLLILLVHTAETLSHDMFTADSLSSLIFMPIYRFFFN
ncbi:MAG: hypothetical protein J6M17_06795 [Ruminococcus sp.]|nr:hypothetical protein [Ruminococcus sp.]